ncbi:MAG: hypothetical protein K9N34_10065, partial [Candidatus Marinimicrobia bacterium]|nr:hypothetical protein [Candidatus Neomarinimicrobiota bacterium]
QVKAQDDSGAVDTSPAMLTLPVANQPPEIEWAVNANPGVTDPNVEHVTFPTRTFVWTVSDLDGVETISRIRWALDDTTNWNYIAGDATSKTLREIPVGYHTFYVQAIDTAGAKSNLLMYPDSVDNTTANGWRVREPVGDVLLVDDFEDDTGYTRDFYTTILDSLYGVSNYTIYQARDGVKAFPTSVTDQTALFGYFKTIIWYHVNKEPRIIDVDQALRTFLENGGNIFVSSLRTDPSYTFTSIDSIKLMSSMRRLSGNLTLDFIDPVTTDSTVILPQFELKTEVNYTIAYNVYCFWPGLLDFGATAKTLIRLREPRNQFENWTGTPPVAELFQPTPTSGKSVFMSLQFNRFTANNNTYQVMDFILNQVFE